MGTNIQWTDETWNPVTGCTKVSQGCKNCYAEKVFPRAYSKDQWQNGDGTFRRRFFTDVECHPDRLAAPLAWRKPRRVFVNSMSDLFHEDVPFEFICKVIATCIQAKQHTFQILTKRPERMLEWSKKHERERHSWPAPNVWLGVSVEDQATADERIPLLLETPAAARWVSYEPALALVDFTSVWMRACPTCDGTMSVHFDGGGKPCPTCLHPDGSQGGVCGIDWVVVGGESGPRARPFNIEWARSTVRQCKAAGVPVFVKQLGRFVIDRNDAGFEGDDVSSWPAKQGLTAEECVALALELGTPEEVR